MFKPGFQLPTQKGVDVFPSAMQQPPVMRTEVLASKEWLKTNYAQIPVARDRIISQHIPSLHHFVMGMRQQYALSPAPYLSSQQTISPNLAISYVNNGGQETITLRVWPEATDPTKQIIEIGNMWKIGYDNDGVYKEDADRNYSSRPWTEDDPLDQGIGTAIYTKKDIPELVYWEVEIVELGKSPHDQGDGFGGVTDGIDWSSDTPPLGGFDKGVPAIGVQPDKGLDFYISVEGEDSFLTEVFIEPVDKPEESDIRVHYGWPIFLYPGQVGQRPKDIEGASLEGTPIGAIVPRAVGMFRYYVQEPTGTPLVTTIQTGGGWTMEIVYTTGVIPKGYEAGKYFPLYKMPVSSIPVPPVDDPLVTLLGYPEHYELVAGDMAPDWFYPASGPNTDLTIDYGHWSSAQPYIVKSGGMNAVESAADTIWTSWGQYDVYHVYDPTILPWNATEAEAAAAFEATHGVPPVYPHGYAPIRIVFSKVDLNTVSNYFTRYQWITNQQHVGEIYGKWKFLTPTTETVVTYPDTGDPYFKSYQYGWHTIAIQGGENSIDVSGDATPYTSTRWLGIDTGVAWQDRDDIKDASKPGDVVMIAMNQKTLQIWFGMNGEWFGEKPTKDGTGDGDLDGNATYYPAVSYARGATKLHMLFGPAQKYAAPEGFERLGGSTKIEV